MRGRKSNIYKSRRKTLLKFADRRCPDCKRLMWSHHWENGPGALAGMATVDHIHPKSKGGTDDMENLRVICHACNNAKADN